MATTPRSISAMQVVQLIRQHKDAIRNALGSPPTGTGTGQSDSQRSTFAQADYDRVAKSLNIPVDQAQELVQTWPVYQLGFEDGQQTPKS